ncbi:MAG TPA: MlaD family protein [Candidatus Binatia bacterium]
MSAKISPTIIGSFVVGALVLLIIAVIAFGSGRLFRQSKEFVLYFDSSVNGLRVGAPVKLKGVEIGSVKDIRLQLEKELQVDKIPVIIEIDLEKLTSRGADSIAAGDREAFRRMIVVRGLRGQLLMESVVTGLLYVGLDLFPGTPINLVQKPEGNYKFTELPTLPTYLEQAQDTATKILAKLEEVDYQGLMNTVTAAIDGFTRLVDSPALKSSLNGLERTIPKLEQAVLSIHKLAAGMDANTTALATNLERSSDVAREAMEQAAVAMKQTDAALKEAQAVMINIREMSDPDSSTSYELNKSLREVSAAARSLRLLSGYVERNPRALLFGKPESGEER